MTWGSCDGRANDLRYCTFEWQNQHDGRTFIEFRLMHLQMVAVLLYIIWYGSVWRVEWWASLFA